MNLEVYIWVKFKIIKERQMEFFTLMMEIFTMEIGLIINNAD